MHLLQEVSFSQNLNALIIFNFWSVSHVYGTSWETQSFVSSKSVIRFDFNFGPIECSFDCVSLIFIFFIVRDIQSDYHRRFTRWLIYVSCALNFVALKCWENCRTSFPISKQRKLKVFTNINKLFGTLFRLWWAQCNPTSTPYTRAVVQVKSGDEIW